MSRLQAFQFADRVLTFFFFALIFFVPLVMTQATSEVFEFNKIILTYALSVIILAVWVAKMIIAKKIIFRRTLLDLPLLLFLLSQFLSFLVSIDKHTSFWGYYSRWNGGFLSSSIFALLYWAFVANFDIRKTQYAIRFLLASALLVAFWGIPAHFGRDPTCLVFGYGLSVDCWTAEFVPTVRIFSTLGQANWLAAWLVAIAPLAWALTISKFDKYFFFISYFSSFIFFWALLLTQSRSGFLGFLAAFAIFWAGVFWLKRKAIKTLLRSFLIFNFSFLILAGVVGTPFTSPLTQVFQRFQSPPANNQPLPTGITPSGDIRQIVWRGAIDVWRANPALGTGPETFAYSYYNFRPAEHNLTSEWDYLYNKAHNEYLNYLANTGIVGLGAYLLLIGTFLAWAGFTLISANGKQIKANQRIIRRFAEIRLKFAGISRPRLPVTPQTSVLVTALVAGYVSILVTNFFGFSVVPVQILFFLFPAFALTPLDNEKRQTSTDQQFSRQKSALTTWQKVQVLGVTTLAGYLLLGLGRVWLADTHYAQAERLSDSDQDISALPQIRSAISLSPAEPVYLDELANISSSLAQQLAQSNQATAAAQLAQTAIIASNKALSISPRNLNFLKMRATMFLRLAALDQRYLAEGRKTLEVARRLAPTDPKVAYNLALFHYRLGETEQTGEVLRQTINLKPDHRDARYTLALVLQEEGKKDEAVKELEYILKNINPEDSQAKEKLEELKGLLK